MHNCLNKPKTLNVIFWSLAISKINMQIDLCVCWKWSIKYHSYCCIGNECVCFRHINVCKAIRKNLDVVRFPIPFHIPPYPFKSVKHSVTINNHIASAIALCLLSSCVFMYVCNSLRMLNSWTSFWWLFLLCFSFVYSIICYV